MDLLHELVLILLFKLTEINCVTRGLPKAFASFSKIGGQAVCYVSTIDGSCLPCLPSLIVDLLIQGLVVVVGPSGQVPRQGDCLVVRGLRHLALADHFDVWLVFGRVVLEHFLSMRSHLGTNSCSNEPRDFLPIFTV